MSFLYRTQPAFRTLSRSSPRLFSSAVVQRKSATETVQDAANKVNKAVGDAAASGIEKGQEAAAKARHATGIKSGEATEKANELKHDVKGKAYEAEGKVKGTVEQAKGKM